MTVSIADVAQRANVSISTVSRVINRRDDLVNARTRARVESAIQELGYKPNAFARGLVLRKSELVALVLPDLHGEFYSEIIRGADSQARESGYNLVVSSAHDAADSHSLLHATQQRSILDGVAVMIADVTDGIHEVLSNFRLPFVVLDGDIEGVPHDSVCINQRHGASELTRHLITRCRAERLIFIGGPSTNVDTLARLEACRAALAETGRKLDAADVYHLDYEFETAYQLALARLREWVGPRTAIFAANDEMASGVVAAAAALGVAVPRDLAVAGFDDTRVARLTRPALTTVRVPMSRMGSEAIKLLCDRISDARRAPRRVSLQPELVVRESCGAVALAASGS